MFAVFLILIFACALTTKTNGQPLPFSECSITHGLHTYQWVVLNGCRASFAAYVFAESDYPEIQSFQSITLDFGLGPMTHISVHHFSVAVDSNTITSTLNIDSIRSQLNGSRPWPQTHQKAIQTLYNNNSSVEMDNTTTATATAAWHPYYNYSFGFANACQMKTITASVVTTVHVIVFEFGNNGNGELQLSCDDLKGGSFSYWSAWSTTSESTDGCKLNNNASQRELYLELSDIILMSSMDTDTDAPELNSTTIQSKDEAEVNGGGGGDSDTDTNVYTDGKNNGTITSEKDMLWQLFIVCVVVLALLCCTLVVLGLIFKCKQITNKKYNHNRRGSRGSADTDIVSVDVLQNEISNGIQNQKKNNNTQTAGQHKRTHKHLHKKNRSKSPILQAISMKSIRSSPSQILIQIVSSADMTERLNNMAIVAVDEGTTRGGEMCTPHTDRGNNTCSSTAPVPTHTNTNTLAATSKSPSYMSSDSTSDTFEISDISIGKTNNHAATANTGQQNQSNHSVNNYGNMNHMTTVSDNIYLVNEMENANYIQAQQAMALSSTLLKTGNSFATNIVNGNKSEDKVRNEILRELMKMNAGGANAAAAAVAEKK